MTDPPCLGGERAVVDGWQQDGLREGKGENRRRTKDKEEEEGTGQLVPSLTVLTVTVSLMCLLVPLFCLYGPFVSLRL